MDLNLNDPATWDAIADHLGDQERWTGMGMAERIAALLRDETRNDCLFPTDIGDAIQRKQGPEGLR